MHAVPLSLAVLTLLVSASAVRADPGPTFRSGQWESTMTDDDRPDEKPTVNLVCRKADMTLDSQTISNMMAGTKAKCSDITLTTEGTVTSYSVSCQMADMTMHSKGTMTVTGPDAYTSKGQSRVEGGKVNIPEHRVTVVSRRLGLCQPGDMQSQF